MKYTESKLLKITGKENGQDAKGNWKRIELTMGNNLYLNVNRTRSGLSRNWQIRVKVPQTDGTRKTRKQTIGTFNPNAKPADPKHLTLKQAMAKAFVMRDQVALGIKGDGIKTDQTIASTGDAYITYLERKQKEDGRTSEWPRIVESQLQKHIYPYIGTDDIGSLSEKKLQTHCAMLFDHKGASIHLTKRVWNYLVALGKFAHGRGAFDGHPNPVQNLTNPYSEMLKNRKRKQAHPSLSHDELEVFMNTVYDFSENNVHTRQYRYGAMMSLLTGLRSIEVARLRWDFLSVDDVLDVPVMDIPEEYTKNGVALRLPITPQMQYVIDRLRDLSTGSDWMIEHADGNHDAFEARSGVARAIRRSVNRNTAITGGKWTFHSLRSTVINYLTKVECPDQVNRAIVNHKEQGARLNYVEPTLMTAQKQRFMMRYHLLLELASDGRSREAERLFNDIATDPAIAEMRAMVKQETGLRVVSK